MGRGLERCLFALSLLLVPGAAWGESELAEVVPGVALTDVEMSQLRGRGSSIVCGTEGDFSTCIGSGGEVNQLDNSENSSVNAIDHSFEFADGILTITQFTGNGNRVDVFINLEVNLNRVTIGDGNTAVTVTQSLDFGNLTGSLQNLKFDD
jgi:hypothetical protein